MYIYIHIFVERKKEREGESERFGVNGFKGSRVASWVLRNLSRQQRGFPLFRYSVRSVVEG